MEVNYDIWTGESLQELIQTIAEFQFQLFIENQELSRSLSEEINFLQHYFDSESCIIVANDCGAIVGYMALVDYSDYHHVLNEYEHYGADLKISEGPLIHPNYRNMGIAKGLIQEAINACEFKDVSLLMIDPPMIDQSENVLLAAEKVAAMYGFNPEIFSNKKIYKKTLVI